MGIAFISKSEGTHRCRCIQRWIIGGQVYMTSANQILLGRIQTSLSFSLVLEGEGGFNPDRCGHTVSSPPPTQPERGGRRGGSLPSAGATRSQRGDHMRRFFPARAGETSNILSQYLSTILSTTCRPHILCRSPSTLALGTYSISPPRFGEKRRIRVHVATQGRTDYVAKGCGDTWEKGR